MKSPRRVVVTGMGSLSALGEGADQLFDRLASGASGIRKLERFDELAHELDTAFAALAPTTQSAAE